MTSESTTQREHIEEKFAMVIKYSSDWEVPDQLQAASAPPP